MMSSVFLLQMTECCGAYEPTFTYIQAAYSTHPTKKQLVGAFKELEVRHPYEMVIKKWGMLDEYTSLQYEVVEMELL